MREGIGVRELDNDEGNRLLRTCDGPRVRWCGGAGPRWCCGRPRMDVAQIAKVAFTSPDRVREVLHIFNDDGFAWLEPRYSGGWPPTFTVPERREIKKTALSGRRRAFSTWSLSNPAEFLVAEGSVSRRSSLRHRRRQGGAWRGPPERDLSWTSRAAEPAA